MATVKSLAKFLAAIALWGALCVTALDDAGAPYQCGSDMECMLLHGGDGSGLDTDAQDVPQFGQLKS
jgi:hypothetical protein